jgi:hypothetical protein
MFPRIAAELPPSYPVTFKMNPRGLERTRSHPPARGGDYMSAMIAALARGGTARSIAAMMQITAIKSGMRSRRIGARLILRG